MLWAALAIMVVAGAGLGYLGWLLLQGARQILAELRRPDVGLQLFQDSVIAELQAIREFMVKFGKVSTVAPKVPRYQLLKDGKPTGHIIKHGSPQYDEAVRHNRLDLQEI